jgi:hypothetical protein
MSKPRVTFKFNRAAEGDWQIEAHYPGAEIRYIRGFKTKVEVDEWLAGSLRIDWLRSQGYAKCRRPSLRIALPNNSGSRAILTAIRRASSFVSTLACSASASLLRE